MKRHKSSITELFHFFIYYKIFELIISIFIALITFKLFPKPFYFFYDIITQYIKF